jgi:Tol biopolymer transport system component
VSLSSGTRLGPYEIVEPIGAGGMGEVYRAKDPRLGRDVAIKVLPASFSQDADRLRRFEQEAKAAGLLNHPNVTAVYDVGTHDGAPYVVQELLEGETLRGVLAGGKLAPRRAVDYAVQIAHGLAAAHEKGIVHRDLKPENVFVTNDGRVKILDFGLAKLTQQEKEPAATDLPTATRGTEPGVVLGTIGYMSPEQVRGKTADARSDIFSFGAILYEALSGKRAFTGDSAADTMSAILREDPPELSVTNQSVSPALERIVRHCLEKSPERRFHSAHDLAFDLEALSTPSGLAAAPPDRGRRRIRLAPLAALAAAAAIAAAGYLVGRRGAEKPPLSFLQLTFRRGSISAARFGPDGQSFVYSARWEGALPRIFTGRAGTAESTPLAMPNAALAGVSARGELLAQLDSFPLRGFTFDGTLASVPLAGGSPRPLLENIQWADWAPDGTRYAVVRDAAGKVQLEFPAGHPLFATAGFITHPRVSPRGDLIAFLEHPNQGDDGGFVSVVDPKGGKRRLTQTFATAWGLAWDPGGSRILFTAAKFGGNRALHAVDLGGREKLIAEVAGGLTLHDVAPGGRALVSRDDARVGMLAMAPGDSVERDLSWLDWTFLRDITADGRTVLFDETGQGGGAGYSIYVRGVDGSPAVRLGNGSGSSLSRDGKWVMSVPITPPPQQLVALPTGPGESRPLTHDAINHHSATWLPDGRGFVTLGDEPGRSSRLWVQEVGGVARPISPEGMEYFYIPISPDGRWVAGRSHDRQVRLYSTQGAAPRQIPGIETADIPLRFSEDGRELYVLGRQLPAQVFRVNLESGRREMWKELMPADRAGVASIFTVLPAADGRAYVYSYSRTLSQVYLVEGLK